MTHSFTAIDFETAQAKRWSICQVGLVRVENGTIKETVNRLVCPPDNYYFYKNIEVHGITPVKTCTAPTFSAIWEELKPFIQNQTVVAHNGVFDFSCLKQTLEFYGIGQPQYQPQCTLKIYNRKGLADLCREHKIELRHHDALSDALACAELYGRYLRNK